MYTTKRSSLSGRAALAAMNLPDRDAFSSLLADFAEVQIDSDEWSTNGGAFVNHDWHAVAVR